MKFLTNLDLSQNEIQNAVIQPLAAAPANPKLGQIYYNSSDSLLYQYDGAQWKPVGKGYELPAATKTALGGIKVGDRLTVAADGTLSADKQTDNNLTVALKANYDTAYQHSQASHAPADAEKNVQADWNVEDTNSDAYIQNKPTIPKAVTKTVRNFQRCRSSPTPRSCESTHTRRSETPTSSRKRTGCSPTKCSTRPPIWWLT